MGWGLEVRGIRTVMDALDDIGVTIQGDIIYVTGTNVRYAVYQEYGTSDILPRPAMRKARDHVQRRVPAIVEGSDNMEQAVLKVAVAIEREWRQNIRDMDIIDTGNYRDSVRFERVD